MSAAAMAMIVAAWMAAKRVAEKASSEVGMRAIPMVGRLVAMSAAMDTTTVAATVDSTAAWSAERWVSEVDAMTVAWTAARMVEILAAGWAAMRAAARVQCKALESVVWTVAWSVVWMALSAVESRGTPLVDKMVAMLVESLACEAVAMMASKPAA